MLVSIGVVSELSSRLGRRSYQLGRSADNLTLAELLASMRDKGEQLLHLRPHPPTIVALEVCQEMDDILKVGLSGRTLKDLVQHCSDWENDSAAVLEIAETRPGNQAG